MQECSIELVKRVIRKSRNDKTIGHLIFHKFLVDDVTKREKTHIYKQVFRICQEQSASNDKENYKTTLLLTIILAHIILNSTTSCCFCWCCSFPESVKLALTC